MKHLLRVALIAVMMLASGLTRLAAQSPAPESTSAPESVSAPGASDAPSDADTALVPIPAPKTPEQVAEVRARIQQRLAVWPAEEAPADADSSGLRVVEQIKSLRATLQGYLKQLDALEAMQRRAVHLASEDAITARAARLAKYKSRIEELQRITRDASIDDGVLRKEIAAEYEKINALHDTANQQQTQRAANLAELPKRTAAIVEEQTKARAALSEALQAEGAPPVGVDPAAFARLHQARLEELAARVSTINLRAERAAVEKTVYELENAAAESVLPVLQAYARAAGDCRSRLEKQTARGEAEVIAFNLQQADTPVDRAYWSYRQLIGKTRAAFLSKLDGIRDRFPESERQRLVRRIERDAGYYERLSERLGRVDGKEKNAAYRRLEVLLTEFQRKADALADELYASRVEKDQLNAQSDLAAEKLLKLRTELAAALETLKGPQRGAYEKRLADLAGRYRPELEAALTRVLTAENELIARLEVAHTKLEDFLETLAGYRDSLFWSFTLARGPHLLSELRAGLRAVAAKAFRRDAGGVLAKEWRAASGVGPGWLAVAAAFVVIGLAGGLLMRHRLRSMADAHELLVRENFAESGATEVGFSDRFRIQMSRMVGAAAPLGWPAVLLCGQVAWSGSLSADGRRLGLRMLGMLLGFLGAWVLPRHLFAAGKPRFRMLSCSNVVAQYYRRWLTRMWWWSLICVPPVVMLSTLGVGEDVSEPLWSAYRFVLLGMLLLFARRRQAVLRVVGRAFVQRRPTLFSLIARMYLIVFLALLTLWGMSFAGFATFVDFVMRGVLNTVAAFVLATMLADLIEDLVRKYTTPAVGASPTEEADSGAELEDLFEEFESREMGLAIRTFGSFARWTVWLAAWVWVLAAWGVTVLTAKKFLAIPLAQTEGGAITVQRVVGAIFTLWVVVKLSRGLRATLNEKVYPAYGTINRAARATINSLLHYTLVVVGLYVALQLVHVNLGALAVLLGGLGLGLGLGLQPLVVNFVSGLLIFAERHVKVGDLVEVDGELGEVVGISMRSTQIKSFDNIDRIIPNAQFMTSSVTNWTLRDTRIRGKINLGVAYGTDPQRVRELLLEIARAEPLVNPEPEPAVWFTNFGDNSLDFVLACWFASPGDRWNGMVNMRYDIDQRFKNENIEIPFPQRTLSLHPDAELPVRLVRSSASTETSAPDAPRVP